MDTESGRIYSPDEFQDRKKGKYTDDHQVEFERNLRDGRIVPVSDVVATQQLRGQAHVAKKKARKAEKAARKRNR